MDFSRMKMLKKKLTQISESKSGFWLAWGIALLYLGLKLFLRGIFGGNELDVLLSAKTFADPTYLQNDWYLQNDFWVRVPFFVLIYPLVKWFPLILVSLIGRLLGLGFVSFAFVRLVKLLGLSTFQIVASIIIFVELGQGLFAGEWIFGSLEPKVISYGLIFLGLSDWLANKRERSVVFFGLATTFHVLVGGWATMTLGILFLVSGPRRGVREMLKLASLWMIAAGPALAMAATYLVENQGGVGFNSDWIYVFFRNPHHAVPTFFTWATWKIGFVGLLLYFMGGLIISGNTKEKIKIVAKFSVLTMVPFVLGCWVTLFSYPEWFLKFLPFRLADSLVMIFGIVLLIGSLGRYLPKKQFNGFFILIVILGLGNSGYGFYQDFLVLRDFPLGTFWSPPTAIEKSHYEACVWIRNHTEPDSIILSSPAYQSTAYLTSRASIVSFKNVPTTEALIGEWYRRIHDVVGTYSLQTRGIPSQKEIDNKFRSLPVSTYFGLGREYKANYLLIRTRSNQLLPAVYQNRYWKIFRLNR